MSDLSATGDYGGMLGGLDTILRAAPELRQGPSLALPLLQTPGDPVVNAHAVSYVATSSAVSGAAQQQRQHHGNWLSSSLGWLVDYEARHNPFAHPYGQTSSSQPRAAEPRVPGAVAQPPKGGSITDVLPVTDVRGVERILGIGNMPLQDVDHQYRYLRDVQSRYGYGAMIQELAYITAGAVAGGVAGAAVGSPVRGALLGAEGAGAISSRLNYKDSWARTTQGDNYRDPRTNAVVSPGRDLQRVINIPGLSAVSDGLWTLGLDPVALGLGVGKAGAERLASRRVLASSGDAARLYATAPRATEAFDQIGRMDSAYDIHAKYPEFSSVLPELVKAKTGAEVAHVLDSNVAGAEYLGMTAPSAGMFSYPLTKPVTPVVDLGAVGSEARMGRLEALAQKTTTRQSYVLDPETLEASNVQIDPSLNRSDMYEAVRRQLTYGNLSKEVQAKIFNEYVLATPAQRRVILAEGIFRSTLSKLPRSVALDPEVQNQLRQTIGDSMGLAGRGGDVYGFSTAGVDKSEFMTDTGAERLALFTSQRGPISTPDYAQVVRWGRQGDALMSAYGKIDDGLYNTLIIPFKRLATFSGGFAERVALNEAIPAVLRNGVGNTMKASIASEAAKLNYQLDTTEVPHVAATVFKLLGGVSTALTGTPNTDLAAEELARKYGLPLKQVASLGFNIANSVINNPELRDLAVELTLRHNGHIVSPALQLGNFLSNDAIGPANQANHGIFAIGQAGSRVRQLDRFQGYSAGDLDQALFWHNGLLQAGKDEGVRQIAAVYRDAYQAALEGGGIENRIVGTGDRLDVVDRDWRRWAGGPVETPSVFNLGDFMGRGDQGPIIPGLSGELSTQLDDIDMQYINNRIQAALDRVANADEFHQEMRSMETDAVMGRRMELIQQASQRLLSDEMQSGSRVFVDDWVKGQPQKWLPVDFESLGRIRAEDILSDNVVVVPAEGFVSAAGAATPAQAERLATTVAFKGDREFLADQLEPNIRDDMARSSDLDQWAVDRVDAVKGLTHSPDYVAAYGDPQGSTATPHMDLLEKLSQGEAPDVERLGNIPIKDRPLQVIGRVTAPDTSGNVISKIATAGWGRVIGPFVETVARDHQYLLAVQKQMERYGEQEAAGLLTHEEAIMAAEYRGTYDTLRFVHNPEERTQMATLVKNFIPFYFAQEQSYRRFGRLLLDDPAAFRREMQMIVALHNYVSHVKDQTGISQFVFPGLGLLDSTFVTGVGAALHLPLAGAVPTQISGNVTSLNNILPFGESFTPRPEWSPFVAVPAHLLGVYDPALKPAITRLVGGPATEAKVWETAMPNTFLRNMFKAIGPSQDLTATQVSQQLSTMVDLQYRQNLAMRKWTEAGHAPDDPGAPALVPGPNASPEEVQTFYNRLRNQSRIGSLFKALLGTLTPLAPSVSVGDMKLKREVSDLIKQYGVVKGRDEFIRRNPDAGPYEVAESDSTISPYKSSQDWANAHMALLKAYPQAASFFVPQDGQRKYDPAIYQEQLALGIRHRRDLTSFRNDMYIAMGNHLYYDEYLPIHQERLDALYAAGDTEGLALERHNFSQWVQNSFGPANPIWWRDFNDPQRQQNRQLAIDQLHKMYDDGTAPTGSYSDGLKLLLRDYDAHLLTLSDIKANGGGTDDNAAENTDWLTYLGGLKRDHPEYGAVINRLFLSVNAGQNRPVSQLQSSVREIGQ